MSAKTDLIESSIPTCPLCRAEWDIFDEGVIPFDLCDEGPHLCRCPSCERFFFVTVGYRFITGAQYEEPHRRAMEPLPCRESIPVELVRADTLRMSVDDVGVLDRFKELGWEVASINGKACG